MATESKTPSVAEMMAKLAEMEKALKAAQQSEAAARLMAEKAQKTLVSLTDTGAVKLSGIRGGFGVVYRGNEWRYILSNADAVLKFLDENAAAVAAGDRAAATAKAEAKGAAEKQQDAERQARVAAYKAALAGK